MTSLVVVGTLASCASSIPSPRVAPAVNPALPPPVAAPAPPLADPSASAEDGDTDPEVERAIEELAAARREVGAVLEQHQRALLALLESENPRVRHLALAHLATAPGTVPAESLDRVVSQLGDREPRNDERCIHLLGLGDTMSQGIIYEQAECRFRAETMHARAIEVLAGHPDSVRVVGALARRARTAPPSEALPALLEAIEAMPRAPAWPIVDALGEAEDDRQRIDLLILAQHADDVPASETLTTLLASETPRVRFFAASLLARDGAPPDDTAAREATRVLRAMLRDASEDDRTWMLHSLARAPHAARALLPELARLHPENGVIEAIGAAGAAAAPHLALVRRELRQGDAAAALRAVIRIGPRARGALADVIAAPRREQWLLELALEAVQATGASISAADYAALHRMYAAACEDAGSIPFFSLSRDASCASVVTRLEAIAAQWGFELREVGW